VESPAQNERERRWASESGFFDNIRYDSEPLHTSVVERYLKCERPNFSDDYAFLAMGDLSGKTVLEIGCGDGWRSIVMALRGARVVSLDISSKAVAAARARAEQHGLLDRIQFHVTPIGFLPQARNLIIS